MKIAARMPPTTGKPTIITNQSLNKYHKIRRIIPPPIAKKTA
jgi:hypothetical protein